MKYRIVKPVRALLGSCLLKVRLLGVPQRSRRDRSVQLRSWLVPNRRTPQARHRGSRRARIAEPNVGGRENWWRASVTKHSSIFSKEFVVALSFRMERFPQHFDKRA